jgi:hypothetical protein
VQAAGRELGGDLGKPWLGDLSEPQMHRRGGFCQQFQSFAREPCRPWLGVFVCAEQDVDLAWRLCWCRLLGWCDLCRSLGMFCRFGSQSL